MSRHASRFSAHVLRVVALAATLGLAPVSVVRAGDPFADLLIGFDPGKGGAMGYDDPFTTLGSPERFTGEGIFPGVVSPFNPAFGTDEIVSIGAGGHLIVAFDAPVLNDALNPFGVDLLIFGNAGFIDDGFPNGIVGGLFGADGGVIEVSSDGSDWRPIKGIDADGMFPTMGYVDSGPYDTDPGSIWTDFTRPVDPSVTLADLLGFDYDALRQVYDGSGGGVGVDIGSVGLASISFVRISNPSTSKLNIEIDAFADVASIPSPAIWVALGLGSLAFRRRRR